MKKILALVSFLTVLAACTAPTGNTNMTSNANTNTTAETKSTAGASEADLIAKEKAGWDAIKKKDWDGLGKLLASDFIDVENDGVYDKAGSIASLKDYNLTDITYSDWRMARGLFSADAGRDYAAVLPYSYAKRKTDGESRDKSCRNCAGDGIGCHCERKDGVGRPEEQELRPVRILPGFGFH